MLNPAMFKLLEIVENQLSNEISASEELTEEEIAEMEEPLFFGEIEWKCTDMTEANITGCNILLLVTIFAVIFINGELKNGYIKNLTGFAFKRSRLVIANMIIVAIYTIISLLACFIATTAITALLFSNSSMGDLGEFAKVFGVQILLHLAFAFFVSSLTYFVRSSVMPMIVGISLASGMGALIYQLLSLAVNKIFDPEKDFDLTKYTLSGNVLSTVSKGNDLALTMGSASSDDLIRATIVAIICGAAAVIVGCIVTEKKDIK
jgi:ABC-type transport system involved in multi-copper enzyme maturation permease subunit